MLDLDRLCWRLQKDSLEEVRKNLEAALKEQFERKRFEREACWTVSLAVGSVGFLKKVRPFMLSRQETALATAAKRQEEDNFINLRTSC